MFFYIYQGHQHKLKEAPFDHHHHHYFFEFGTFQNLPCYSITTSDWSLHLLNSTHLVEDFICCSAYLGLKSYKFPLWLFHSHSSMSWWWFTAHKRPHQMNKFFLIVGKCFCCCPMPSSWLVAIEVDINWRIVSYQISEGGRKPNVQYIITKANSCAITPVLVAWRCNTFACKNI